MPEERGHTATVSERFEEGARRVPTTPSRSVYKCNDGSREHKEYRGCFVNVQSRSQASSTLGGLPYP